MRKIIIIVLVAFILILTGCSLTKRNTSNDCCPCKDCPSCDMCCPCE